MIQAKWKNILFGAVGLAIASFSGLFVVEIIIRIIEPQWSDQWKMWRLDPVYARGLNRNITNEVVHGHSGEFNFRFSTNSQGLRMNYNLVNPKPPNRKRIIVVGDSFTFGYGVEQFETFERHLQQMLNSEGERVEVVNAGFASGFTLDTEYLFTREVGKNWQPDIVIVGVSLSNDLGDLGATLWNISDGRLVGLKKSNDWVPLWVKKSGLVNLLVKGMIPKIKAFRHAKSVSDKMRSPCEFPLPISAGHLSEEKINRDPPALDTEAEGWSAEQKAEWIMQAWSHDAAKYGYQLIMLFIPDAEEVQWDTTEQRLSSRTSIRSVFASVATKARIIILDPVADMRRYWCQTGNPLYFKIDGHWSAGGHRFIGEWLAERLSDDVR